MTAHILTGSVIPLPLQWMFAALLFGGIVASLVARPRTARRAAAALAVAGFAGTIAAAALGGHAGAAPYQLRLVAPHDQAAVPSPVFVTVCGIRGDGSTLDAADANHYLVIAVDGREVATLAASSFPLQLASGKHLLRVELVTPAHRAFQPEAVATVAFTVASGASQGPAPRC